MLTEATRRCTIAMSRLEVCESDPKTSPNPIQSDPIGLGSDSDQNLCVRIGSDFMAFMSDWIGFDYVGFFPDQIGFGFHQKCILQGRDF